MTDHHSLTSRDAPAPDSVSAAPDLSVAAGALDGAWFRRERERIAVGRRAIAHQLQVAESRVVALETRQQPVPGPWLPLLAALGFRLPAASAESAAPATDRQPVVSPPQTDVPAAPPPGEPPPSAAATAPSEQVAAASAPQKAAEAAPECEPPAAQSAELVAATPPAAPVSPSPAPAADSLLPGEPAPAAAAPPAAARPPAGPPSRRHSSADGGWLQAERERVGLSRNSLRQLLNVHWATCAKIEQKKLPVPRRWWRKLKEVGFRLPGKPAPARAPSVPAPPPATPKLQAGLRGTWLRRQRQRLGLSDRDLWRALQVHWRTLSVVERHNRIIPAEWLPALERLGMTAAGAPGAASEPRPGRAPAVSPRAAAAPPAAVPAPAQPDGEDVLSMIVKYRLALGRRSRQSAVEIMALIAHDLRTADLSQAITHDQLAAAMQTLLRSRSSAA